MKVSTDSINWQSVYSTKYNKDYWEVPVTQLKTGIEVPGKPVKYIRMKHACAMLEKGSGSISDVAYAIGFNDPRFFSTCFRQEFGITPTEYYKEKRTNTIPTAE